MRHSIGSKQLVIRSKILSPPRGTQKEFTSSKLASTRVSKGKCSKKSIPGEGKPLPSTMEKTQALPKETSVPTGEEQVQPSMSIPAVPVLQSPPPFGLHTWQPPSPTQLVNTLSAVNSNSDSVLGTNVISSNAAGTACNALVHVPKMRAATSKLPSQPGSVVHNSFVMVSPIDMPLEQSCYTPGCCSN